MSEIQWIWQQKNWPKFTWDESIIQPLVRNIRLKQGILLGKTGVTTDDIPLSSILDNVLQNIIASSAIEGEQLNAQSLRSSLAKRMGLSRKQRDDNPQSEGLAQMMLDILKNDKAPLSLQRLYQWHTWLFMRESHLYPIEVGVLRGEETMQVVSGRIDKPKIHYEAPPRKCLEAELQQFIDWFNQSLKKSTLDPLLRAAICHFWFVTIHPFEDGNGRITRALTDLALAQDNKYSIQLYAMSITILDNRRDYYDVLETSQRQTTDITLWLNWFLNMLEKSIHTAMNKIDQTLAKTRFWQTFQDVELSKEQVKILNLMLDEAPRFEEGLSASQYQKITKVSKATATRHLSYLVEKGVINKLAAGGRSTRYKLK